MTLRPAVSSCRAPTDGDQRAAFASHVQYYLSQDPRQLSSRYLYDALGSCLFEAICRLPWYPITRAETRLLAACRYEIFTVADRLVRVIELGCGSGEKLSTLVGWRRPSTELLDLHLIDVSPRALAASTLALNGLDDVRVIAHEAAYEVGLAEIGAAPTLDGRTLLVFLGSNIGNFDPPGAEEFLREIRTALRPGDLFLLGVDLVKPEPLLLLAYDDPLGVTATFNRNLLVRINRELGGNFDLESFAHRVRWNAAASRVEMHLACQRRQVVRIDGADLEFTMQEGESIWTESSYKYEPDEVAFLVQRAGFSHAAQWIDAADQFALTLAQAL